MNTSNMISIYREKGAVWLDELPQLARSLSSKLGLRQLKSGKCSGMKELCERYDVTVKYAQLSY